MNFSNLTASHIRVHTGCKTSITYLLVEVMLFRFTDKKKYKKVFFFVLDNESPIFHNETD